MLVFFFDCKEPLLIDFVPQEETINSNYYCKLLNTLNKKYPWKRPNQKRLGVSLIHDNASSYTSHQTKECLQKIGINTLEHPPYSPDISPYDYAVFGPLKKSCAVNVSTRCKSCRTRPGTSSKKNSKLNSTNKQSSTSRRDGRLFAVMMATI